MKEYSVLLSKYLNDGSYIFSDRISENDWGDVEAAEAYMYKYWLYEKEYLEKWIQVEDSIFKDKASGLKGDVFTNTYSFLPLESASLLDYDDFSLLKGLLHWAKDQYLFVVENCGNYGKKEECYRMKFPSNISWEELNSGNYISSVLTKMYHNEYFVYGDSGKWGWYVANDYKDPLKLIGVNNNFHKKLNSIQKEHMSEIKNLVAKLPHHLNKLIS